MFASPVTSEELPTRTSPSRRSIRTYGALVAVLVAVKLFFLVAPRRFPLEDQASAFSWPLVLGVAAAGLLGLYLAPRAGFPDLWDPSVSNRQRFGLPAVDGVAYGVITVLLDLASPEDVHMSFPASVPFYTYGAIFLEILLRLFALTTLTWLLWKVVFRGRWPAAAFWIANIITALYEPMPFMQSDLAQAPPLGAPAVLVRWALQPLFLANVLTGYLYRRFGFLNPVVLRLVFYLVWHIAYGGFRPFWRGG